MSNLKSEFISACRNDELEDVMRYLQMPEFDNNWINCTGMNGLREACNYGNYEIVEYLLSFVDIINIQYLQIAYTYNQDKIANYLTIIEFLLAHGKFDTSIEIDNIYFFNVAGVPLDFKNDARNLIIEYLYRVDGSIYNQNIIN